MLIKKYKQLAKILNNRTKDDQSHLLFSHHHMIYCLHQQRKQLQQPQLRHRGSSYSFITILGVMSMIQLLLPLGCVDAVGYSYTRFVGPVAGPEHKIYVNAANAATDGKPHGVDYVAKAEYQFAYGVEDADAHILHNRNEMRDGDAVKGVYSLIDPDGALRVVKYTADDINGFQAEVIRNGVSSLHGQLQNDYKRAPPLEISNNYDNPDYEPHHYPQSQTHLKADTNKYYPSSNIYDPNLEQLQKINHQLYNPPNHYQTPPQPPIIYHYNNNDDDSNSDSDYREDPQPQYEVHEKPNNDDHENQKDNDCDDDGNGDGDDNDNDHKSNNGDNVADHKKKKHHPREEEDDDDDYDDEDDSEELEDYDEAVHKADNSEESDEYY
ncbi:uncharacterized protein LOC135953852 [Calliphora vicina]|uniref:uncharacterized protein LOC135953852 n=1 Tax=Calliphora vicina TaxID=7373 RepID=UPI00325B7613